MKHRITTALLLLSVIVTACSKDDFSELRHPIVIEGEFDPVYALPLAKMSADMATIVGMFDYSNNTEVYMEEGNIVGFRNHYYKHFPLTWTASKATPKGGAKDGVDTLHNYTLIEGRQTFELLEKFKDFDTSTFRIHEFWVTVETDVKAWVNESFQEALAEGANLKFDSLVLKINCLDGYTKVLPLLISTDDVPVADLIETRNIPILTKYDLKDVVGHRPTSVDYTVRMCITVPTDQMGSGSDFNQCMRTLGVDSMVTDLHACLEVPVNFYSNGAAYEDTLELDLSEMEEQLANINEGRWDGEHYSVSLNDSNCYIAFVTKNSMPVEMDFSIAFLDGNNNEILHTLFEGDRAIYAAPAIRMDGPEETWVSNGFSTAEFKVHLKLDELKQLSNTRNLVIRITTNTARHEQPGYPFAAVRMDDRLDIRCYAVVAGHADFSLPVNLPDVPFFK